MKPTSILFHNGCKFNLSPMVIKSISNDGGVMRLVVDNVTETGSCVMPCTAEVNGTILTLNLINGDTLKINGEEAQYGGDGR